MPYLLDVNVLIALLDANHVHHNRAMTWFVAEAQNDWLSCPTTQNGTIRIMGGSRYGPTAFSPVDVTERLQLLIDETTHRFIADDVSLMDADRLRHHELKRSSQVTDAYLLALAVSRRAQLATMDERLSTNVVIDGSDHLHRIP
jgi:uncharacterized protein